MTVSEGLGTELRSSSQSRDARVLEKVGSQGQETLPAQLRHTNREALHCWASHPPSPVKPGGNEKDQDTGTIIYPLV